MSDEDFREIVSGAAAGQSLGSVLLEAILEVCGDGKNLPELANLSDSIMQGFSAREKESEG